MSYRVADFNYNGNSFYGIVKTPEQIEAIYDVDYVDCKIIHVISTSNKDYTKGHTFLLEKSALFEEVTKEENPEYFL